MTADSSLSAGQRQAAEQYFAAWWAALREFQKTGRPFREFPGVLVPVAAMQAAALAHPNARTRRDCLTVLDHAANDGSMATFRRALQDSVPRVRLTAVHGLGCQRCKAKPVSGYDVIPDLIGFADAATIIRGALKQQGFGVLTEFDMQATMREKVGEEMEPCIVLGACNPPLARRVLAADRTHRVAAPVQCHRPRRGRRDSRAGTRSAGDSRGRGPASAPGDRRSSREQAHHGAGVTAAQHRGAGQRAFPVGDLMA